MYKEILRSIDDASLFAIVAIIIFTFFFIALFVYVIKMKKGYVQKMSNMPLTEKAIEGERT